MRHFFGFLCLSALAALLLVECGEAGLGGGGGKGGDGGTGGDGPEIASLFGSVYEFDPPPLIVALEGVRVCQLDTDNCATSDKRGLIKLDFPRTNEEIAVTMEKEGYGSWIYPNVTNEAFPEGGNQQAPNPFPMYAHEQLAAIAEQVDTPYPWKEGIVVLVRWQSPHPGTKFMPVGSTVDEVGEAFYWDAGTQQYSLDLAATTFAWGLAEYPLAEGGFTEVTPGVHQFEFGGTAGDCNHASWAWPGDAPNRIRIPVLEGYTTYGSMRCDDPPD